MVVAVFVMYYSNIMSFLDSKFPEILVNPITPYFRSAFTFVVGQLYAALTSIFLNSKSFYFSLVLLASFKSYHDHEFDLAKNWKSWFLNDEMSTSFTSRFNVSFGLEMFSQIAYLVLAVKNPNNKYLWLLVNLNFIQGYLATRSTDIREGHSAEGISVRRHYQGTMVSGFWFYYYNIYKLFTVMSFWRFINKPKNMTDCPYQLGAFVVLILGSGILKYFSNINFPSEKRFGIHGKIRNAERLSEILHVMALLCLCNFSFGNAPLVTSAVYFLFQILDLHIAEECAINRSPSKWKTYFSKVSYRIVPKVY